MSDLVLQIVVSGYDFLYENNQRITTIYSDEKCNFYVRLHKNRTS